MHKLSYPFVRELLPHQLQDGGSFKFVLVGVPFEANAAAFVPEENRPDFVVEKRGVVHNISLFSFARR